MVAREHLKGASLSEALAKVDNLILFSNKLE